MEWHVNGKTYKVQWAHPKTFPGEIQPAGEDAFVIYIADESVAKNDIVDAPPAGDLHVVATKAQTAVGNVLRSRARIDFLRLIKQYPYGMDAGAIGLDGGGDPRAHPLQRDKAAAPTGAQRINTGLLAQPGAFPEAYVDTVPDEDIARANLMLADNLTGGQIEDDRRQRKGLDPKPRFDTVNPPLSELPYREAASQRLMFARLAEDGNGHEDQGTGYDSGAAGHEAQGRRSAPDPARETVTIAADDVAALTADDILGAAIDLAGGPPDPEREGIMRNPDGSPVIGPSGPTHAPVVADLIEATATLPPPTDAIKALDFIESIGAGGPVPTEAPPPAATSSEPGELVPNKD